VNLTYNGLPSLHVALSVSATVAMARELRPLHCWLLGAFAAAIVASTVLTRQHFLADVAAGLLLAAVSMMFAYPRLQGRFAASLATAGAP
jgi:membrane-associated phospholipid phosphatase